MKYFFLFFLFFWIPINTSAKDSYLKEFEVLNGKLSIPFNEKNNIYTIYLEEEATKVEFSYTLEDPESNLEIIDDQWIENENNIMILKIKSQDALEIQTYTFYLEKEFDQTVGLENNEFTSLNITKKERSPYLAPTVILVCISIIFFLFYMLILRYIKKIIRKRNHLHKMK